MKLIFEKGSLRVWSYKGQFYWEDTSDPLYDEKPSNELVSGGLPSILGYMMKEGFLDKGHELVGKFQGENIYLLRILPKSQVDRE